MLVKASFAAGVLVCAAVALSSLDFRQLYNEMYPVNGLRRDVLNLCHQVEPTFVRAIATDRISCYDSMPDPVELAIGWVRTSSRLAAMRKPSPVEVAERLLVAAIQQRRLEPLGPVQFTGYAMVTGGAARACGDVKSPIQVVAKADPALALPDDNLVLRLARGDGAAMAALGLGPHGERPVATRHRPLPILSLGGASGSGMPQGAQDTQVTDPTPTAELGSDAVTPSAAPAICRTPA